MSFTRQISIIPPNIYLCVITQEIMQNPVVSADGHSYEKIAIQEWLSKHNTSPMTGAVVINKELIPNYSLRSSIHDWQAENQDYKIDVITESDIRTMSSVFDTTSSQDVINKASVYEAGIVPSAPPVEKIFQKDSDEQKQDEENKAPVLHSPHLVENVNTNNIVLSKPLTQQLWWQKEGQKWQQAIKLAQRKMPPRQTKEMRDALTKEVSQYSGREKHQIIRLKLVQGAQFSEELMIDAVIALNSSLVKLLKYRGAHLGVKHYEASLSTKLVLGIELAMWMLDVLGGKELVSPTLSIVTAKYGNVALMEALYRHSPIPVGTADAQKAAVKSNNIDVLNLLLDYAPNVAQGNLLLKEAVETNNIIIFHQLLIRGIMEDIDWESLLKSVERHDPHAFMKPMPHSAMIVAILKAWPKDRILPTFVINAVINTGNAYYLQLLLDTKAGMPLSRLDLNALLEKTIHHTNSTELLNLFLNIWPKNRVIPVLVVQYTLDRLKLNCLQQLIIAGAEIPDSAIKYAADNYHRECLQILLNSGAHVSEEIYTDLLSQYRETSTWLTINLLVRYNARKLAYASFFQLYIESRCLSGLDEEGSDCAKFLYTIFTYISAITYPITVIKIIFVYILEYLFMDDPCVDSNSSSVIARKNENTCYFIMEFIFMLSSVPLLFYGFTYLQEGKEKVDNRRKEPNNNCYFCDDDDDGYYNQYSSSPAYNQGMTMLVFGSYFAFMFFLTMSVITVSVFSSNEYYQRRTAISTNKSLWNQLTAERENKKNVLTSLASIIKLLTQYKVKPIQQNLIDSADYLPDNISALLEDAAGNVEIAKRYRHGGNTCCGLFGENTYADVAAKSDEEKNELATSEIELSIV